MTNITTLPTRSQVPLEQTWDLTSVFPTPTEWETACLQLTPMLPTLSAYQGHLGETNTHLIPPLSASQCILWIHEIVDEYRRII